MTEWVTLEMTSADCGDSLQRIMDKGAEIRDISRSGDLTVRFRIRAGDLPEIRKFCGKYDLSLRILSRSGPFRRLRLLPGRPVLLLGMALILALCLYIPEHILFVSVEGNYTVPANRILEAAQLGGVRFGVSRRGIQSERLKNHLLSQIPELQWAGINTYGSHAVITVRERSTETDMLPRSGVSSIVADRDGVILSCTVTKGTGLVAPGQAVKKGEKLISGYSDLGLTIGAGPAEGEVFAATSRSVRVETADTQLHAVKISDPKDRFSLRIGKKRINFYKCSGILDAGCVKMRLEYVLTLPGGLELPVVLIRETVSDRELEETSVDPGTVCDSMSACARDYLETVMVAGVITEKREEMLPEGGCCFLGIYSCREMIGRVRYEEIGVYNGKTD